MASLIAILNLKGETLIFRQFKEDISRFKLSQFANDIIASKDINNSPIYYYDQTYWVHHTVDDIILIAANKADCNCVLVLSYFYTLENICKSYFEPGINEANVRRQQKLLQQLFDETIDYGYPQITDPELLKIQVNNEGLSLKDINSNLMRQTLNQATGAISWRNQNIKQKQNEVQLDVVEEFSALVGVDGSLLRQEVIGTVKFNCKLSGMPECKFGLNDKLAEGGGTQNVSLEDLKFHQCVRLSNFDRDRTITFIPPDGNFELCTYRISNNLKPPFKILSEINERKDSIEYIISIKSLQEKHYYASYVSVCVPVPKNNIRIEFDKHQGAANHILEKSTVDWKLNRFIGENEHEFRMRVYLDQAQTPKRKARLPIEVFFEIPMLTTSGIKVKYLKVNEKSSYKTNKWIRYISTAKSLMQRI